MLVTSKALPVTDLRQFIAYAKKNQSQMRYGALAGTGTTNHIICALFNDVIGVSARNLARQSR